MCCFQISRCAKSPQLKATGKEQPESSLSNLKQWQGVAASSEEEPHMVMDFLLSVQQFDLAAEWAELHVLPQHFYKVRDKARKTSSETGVGGGVKKVWKICNNKGFQENGA